MSRFYGLDKYLPGDTVRIADQKVLEQFFLTWKLHHPLVADQIPLGGQTATIKTSMMYHGGDILYELVEVPGIWHQQLLSPQS